MNSRKMWRVKKGRAEVKMHVFVLQFLLLLFCISSACSCRGKPVTITGLLNVSESSFEKV